MTISIFGESHAPEIGVVIEGVPKGTEIDLAELQRFLDRRAPGNGQGGMSTPRKEPDRVEFTSGVTTNHQPLATNHQPPVNVASLLNAASPLNRPSGCKSKPLATSHQADGSPIRAVIRNTNTRPQDYANARTVPRPGHADYASWLQCGKIPTGGGKWSGRMTAPLCIAGGIALQMLARRGVTIASTVRRGGGDAPVPDGDSVGGIVEVVATGVPAGLGDVGTAGLESKLAAAFFGIPAVKGVEFGDGFALADMWGSRANDAFVVEGTRNEGNAADADKWARRALNAASRLNGPAGLNPPSPQSPNPPTLEVTLRTNHCGGILGGVSVGTPIVARLAFKPTPSISLEQDSVDLATMTPAKIAVKGRHDRCVAFRGAVAAEAAMAIVLETEIFG